MRNPCRSACGGPLSCLDSCSVPSRRWLVGLQVDVRLRCGSDGAAPALAEDVYGPMSGQVWRERPRPLSCPCRSLAGVAVACVLATACDRRRCIGLPCMRHPGLRLYLRALDLSKQAGTSHGVVAAGAYGCGNQRRTMAAAGRRRHSCGTHARVRRRGARCTAGADAAAGAQVTSVMRQAARRAVAAAGPRLVEAMLLCEVAAAAEALAGAPRQSRVGVG